MPALRPVSLIAPLIFILLPSLANAEPDLESALDHLAAGDVSSGLRELGTLIGDTDDAVEKSHLRYLIARTHQQEGDWEQAIRAYGRLEDAAEAGDPWIARARFGRAACLLATGESEDALALFDGDAQQILAPEHRQAIVDQVVAFARVSFAVEDGQMANAGRAMQLYQVVVDLDSDGEYADEAGHALARLSSDVDSLARRVRTKPEGEWVCQDRLHLGLLTQDRRGLGYVAAHCPADAAIQAASSLAEVSPMEALVVVPEVLGRHPEGEGRDLLVRKMLLLQIDLGQAAEALELIPAALDTPRGINAELALDLADALVQVGRLEDARTMWTRVLAESHQQAYLSRAREGWSASRYYEAQLAWQTADVDVAVERLDQLASEIPSELEATLVLGARYLAGDERWDEAETRLQTADNDAARRVLVQLLEDQDKLEEALPLREQLGLGEWTEQLVVVVPRRFTSAEDAFIEVRAEGLHEVELRIHRIRNDDYLRSMGTMQGMGELDVDLIAPDRTVTAPLAARQLDPDGAFGPIQQQVPLEDLEPGVYAVEVLGETQRAMTMVHVSDLEVIARTSDGETVALVYDRVTGRPVRGADVVIGDGREILAEAETGRDGLATFVTDVALSEVIASKGRHAVWAEVAPTYSQPAADQRDTQAELQQVWVHLDRTIAHPGDTVRLAGFVVSGTAPRLAFDGPIEVHMNHGATELFTRTPSVSDGVLEYALELPDDLPPGRYSVAVADRWVSLDVVDQPARSSRFDLRQHLPVRPGEPALMIASLRGVHGHPAVGVAVWGDLADGRGHRVLGLTGEDGELRMEVPTAQAVPAPVVQIGEYTHGVEFVATGQLTARGAPSHVAGGDVTIELDWGEALVGSVRALVVGTPETERRATQLSRPQWWPQHGAVEWRRALDLHEVTIADGAGSLTLTDLSPGNYTIQLHGFDDHNGLAVSSHRFTVRAPDDLHLALDTPASGDGAIPLGYRSRIRLSASGPADRPLLATLEGTGMLAHVAVAPGETVEMHLPATLSGPGRVTLSGTDGEFVQTIHVRDILEVSALFDETEGAVQVQVTDPAGFPREADVLVSMRPTVAPVAHRVARLFGAETALSAAATGVSVPQAVLAHSAAIPTAVLDLDRERLLARMPADSFDLNSFEYEEEPQLALQGYGHGSGGLGSRMGRADGHGTQQGLIGIGRPTTPAEPRRLPVVWFEGRTAPDGTLEVPVDAAALARGWYDLQVVARDDALGQLSGAVVQEPVFVEAPVFTEPLLSGVVRLVQRDHRLLLEEGEVADLDVSRDTWIEVVVAQPSLSGAVAVLLDSVELEVSERAFLNEQIETLAWLHGLPGESVSADMGEPIWAYIAQNRASRALGSVGPSRRNFGELLRTFERTAEDRVTERAAMLLGIARQQPANGQAAAALLRMVREGSLENVEVAGAIALTSVLIEGDQRRDELLPAIDAVIERGPLGERARALEALALLGDSLPVEPASLIAELPSDGAARADVLVAEILGSVVRAAILSDYALSTASEVELVIDGASIKLGPGRTILPTSGATSVSLSAEDGEAAIHVISFRGGPMDDRAHTTLSRTLERHGVFYRGEDIVPPKGEVQASTITAGRRLRLRYDLGRDCRGCVIADTLPPGTRLVPGSLDGLSLTRQRGNELLLGVHREGTTPSLLVEVVQPVEPAAEWTGAVLFRSGSGVVLGLAPDETYSSTDHTVEAVDRLAGRAVMPGDASAITQTEEMALGLAWFRHADGDEVALRGSLDLLRPILRTAELTTEQVAEVGEAAFRAAVLLEDGDAIRDLFSLLETRAPRAEIREAELTAVVRMFVEDGDVEYAMRAWTALLNLRFLAEVGAGERMVATGLISDGIRLVHEMTRVYPDIPSVSETVFNLPQMFLTQAERQPGTPDGRFRAQRFRATANLWLGEYLARYGSEDRAAEAALMHLDIAKQLEDWDRLARLGRQYEDRFDASPLVDSFVFMSAYGQQRLGQYDQARALYERVVDELFHGAWSQDRDRARLALARIDHAEGDLEQAVERYRLVRDLFPDAQAALAIIENPELRLPEIVQAPPTGRVELPLRVRGVDEVSVWAYRVDLERLFVREGQIQAIGDVSLAGIEPAIELQTDLPVNYGSLAEHEIALDLPETGAYLVLARSESARASSLVIVSQLQMDIVQDRSNGSLRVAVTDRDGAPSEGAVVRAAGSGRTEKEATDLRGVALLSGYDHNAHVVARVGDSYAVYRGVTVDRFAAPTDVHTGVAYVDFDDGLIDGASMRAQELRLDNAAMYEQNVWGNRRSTSNFELE